MIDAETIGEILKLYNKHGWTLRRVLLSDSLKDSLKGSVEMLFETSEIRPSDIDAAWFSRASSPARETWEIRHLSETPFALLEVIDIAAADSERNAVLSDAATRLREIVSGKTSPR